MCQADAWLFFLYFASAGAGYKSDFSQNDFGNSGNPILT
jgi:hypothetical protein